jgi:hypothetical protein
MRDPSNPTTPNAQALSKLVIGGNLLALWLGGRVSITPVIATPLPSEPRDKRPASNGNGALADDDVARFIVLAGGPERVRRVCAEFEQPPLPLAAAEAVS